MKAKQAAASSSQSPNEQSFAQLAAARDQYFSDLTDAWKEACEGCNQHVGNYQGRLSTLSSSDLVKQAQSQLSEAYRGYVRIVQVTSAAPAPDSPALIGAERDKYAKAFDAVNAAGAAAQQETRSAAQELAQAIQDAHAEAQEAYAAAFQKYLKAHDVAWHALDSADPQAASAFANQLLQIAAVAANNLRRPQQSGGAAKQASAA